MAYCGDDKFASEEADSRNGAVGEQWDGSERIDNGVSVGQPLQPLELSTIAIPEWAMPAEEDFD